MAFPRKRTLRKPIVDQQFTFVRLEPRKMMAADFQITEFLASNGSGIIDDNSQSSDWIEIYNAGTSSGNLSGYTLTDDASEFDKYTLPSQNLNAGQYLVVFANDDAAPNTGNDIYTGFKLSAGGEYVALFDPAGNLISEFGDNGADYPIQTQDVSYGVQFSGSSISSPREVGYFNTPTPGQANGTLTAGFTASVLASTPAGFYEDSFQVSLSTTTSNATIRYTTDGSTPSATNGQFYNNNNPIIISGTTNLRAVATRTNFNSSPSETWSYIFVDDVITQSPNGQTPNDFPSTWGGNDVDYGIDPQVIAAEGAETVKNALLSIPTWSITTDIENLFDDQTGIYANALQDGREWERPASVELLNPDGSEGFQVNAGIRIRGGFSRVASNPKHSFRLFFRSEYGDSELDYAVHGDRGVDTFEKIDLRTAQNYSWSKDGDSDNNFIIDQFNRENQLALGQPSTRSSWLHLYLNGQYWGLFQTQERADADFAESYLGGDADDYDVIKPDAGPRRPYTNAATDGDLVAYNALYQQALARAADGTTPAFIDNAAYYEAQGLNPDGTPNASFETLLDVDNLIDYMTLILQSGNFDAPITQFGNPSNRRLNNYNAIRSRTGDEGFQFFVHDAEHSYKSVDEDRNGPYNHPNFETGVDYFNPQWLHQQLMANDEYRIAFADRIQEVFFNGGVLSTESLLARYDGLAEQIDEAIIGESARWGDAQTTNPLLRSDWVKAVAELRTDIISQRNDEFLDQLRSTVLELRNSPNDTDFNRTVQAPLFPSIDAPEFIVEGTPQHGGLVNVGDGLQLTNTSGGTLYYTTDGTDPREVGGAVNSAAQTYDGSTSSSTVFGTGSSWRYNDSGQNLGTNWRNPNFNDSGWDVGDARFGNGDTGLPIETQTAPASETITTYFRKQFTLTDDFDFASISINRDDAVVVYLNGTEVVRDNNFPSGTITYLTQASNAISGNAESQYNSFDIPASLLINGVNTLAVEVHQASNTSSDLAFDAALTVGQSVSGTPVAINTTTPVLSRALSSNGTWSALQSATFVVADGIASSSNIRVSEINYNPVDGGAEFIELQNIGGATVDLSGVTLTEGPSVPLTLADGTTLDPGQFGLLVSDVAAFAVAYPNVDPALILGTFEGGLSNSGEDITLVAADGSEIADFEYSDSDPFPIATDGAGASLELISPATTPAEQLGKFYAYQSSFAIGGTPGAAAAIAPSVVINEVFAHSDAPNVDFIELRNNGSSSVNVGGWYLSDSADALNSFQIPAGTVISAGGYLVFDEIDFNSASSGANAFALSSEGDEVWLTSGTGDSTRFIDALDFGATFNSQSIGRSADGTGRLLPSASRTPGTENSAAAVSPLVISEVNYHPDSPSDSDLAIEPGITEGDLEFIELTNTLATSINLSDYRLRGESDFDFTNETIAANQSVVLVGFDPNDQINVNRTAAFRSHYGIANSVTLIGAADGGLSNSFGRVSLQRADTPNADGSVPFALVDELLYDDLAPWADADGTGLSLSRVAANANGTLSSSWVGVTPTPGSNNLQSYAPEVLASVRDNGEMARPDLIDTISFVFDADVIVNKSHLQLLNQTLNSTVNVNVASVVFSYDATTLTATWDVSSLDLNEAYFLATLSQSVRARGSNIALDGDENQTAGGNHVQQIYVAIPGDANLDGDVDVNNIDIFTGNTGDAAVVLSNLQRTGRINWSTGDFNADGDVDATAFDFISGTQTGDYAVLLANLGKDVGNFPSSIMAQSVILQPLISQPAVSQQTATQPIVPEQAPLALIVPPTVEPTSDSTAVFSTSTEQAAVTPKIAPAEFSITTASDFISVEPVSVRLLSESTIVVSVSDEGVDPARFAPESYAGLAGANSTSLSLAGAHDLVDSLFSDEVTPLNVSDNLSDVDEDGFLSAWV